MEVKGDTPYLESVSCKFRLRSKTKRKPHIDYSHNVVAGMERERRVVKAMCDLLVPNHVGNRGICLRSTKAVQAHRKRQVVGSTPIGGSRGSATSG